MVLDESRQNVNDRMQRKPPGSHGRGTVACPEYVRGIFYRDSFSHGWFVRVLTMRSFSQDGLVTSMGKDVSLEGRLLLAASKNNRREAQAKAKKKFYETFFKVGI